MNATSSNSPCPCGSGKKFKNCCLGKVRAIQATTYKGSQQNRTPAQTVDQLLQAGLQHHQAGRLSEAEATYQRILKEAPDNAEALHLLGLIFYQAGRFADATKLIRQAICIKPTARMYFNLGNVYRDQGNPDEAVYCFRQALLLKPDYPQAYSNLGVIFQAQAKLGDASASFRKALLLKPDYVDAHRNLGNLLQAQGQLHCATESFRKALQLTPHNAELHNRLGNILIELGELESSIIHYDEALSLKQDFAEAHFNLGVALGLKGDPEKALESFQKALKLKPDYPDAYAGAAGVYIDLGQFENAEAAISRALEIHPLNPTALATVTRIRKMTSADSDWINSALSVTSSLNVTLSPHEAIGIQFAIGKYYDDTEQFDLAFAAYQQGNALRRRISGGVNRAELSKLVDALIAVYTIDVANQKREGASLSQRPVLIVGMPRSGTSLIEQIISSHPDAAGAGELFFWGAQAKEYTTSVMSGSIEPELIRKIATEYEQLLLQYSVAASRVVDKMPDNFFGLGFIRAIFPMASIVHVQRNPVDTCLSIYFQNFGSSYSYGTDLDDLAFFYREYARLMQHWRAVFHGNRFLDVPYEALVDDQALWSKRIIEFIGLNWDDRCLDFHKIERKVGTSSNWQVRQKIYHSSKKRWRNYEKHLGPLLGLLDLV